jgi:hypothetical protein
MRDNRRLLTAVSALLLLFLFIGLLWEHSNKAPRADSSVSKEALAAISRYEQAKQNSVGADQTSPSSWLNEIKPITTPSFWSSLQPNSSSTTSDVSYDYTYAHQNNLVVRISLSNCYWSSIYAKPTANSGVVLCGLNDTTINSKTGQTVPVDSLQFGWTRTGKQTPPNLTLVKLNNHWLIESDNTGKGF